MGIIYIFTSQDSEVVGERDAAALAKEGARQRRQVSPKKKKLQTDLHLTESERVVQPVLHFGNGTAHFIRRVLDGMYHEAISRVPTSPIAGRARHCLRTAHCKQCLLNMHINKC